MIIHFDTKTGYILGTQRGFEPTPDLISYPNMTPGDTIDNLVLDINYEEIFEKEITNIHLYKLNLDADGNFIGFKFIMESEKPDYMRGK